MSTKIYNGFKFKNISSLDDLYPILNTWRLDIKKIVQTEQFKLIGKNLTFNIDKSTFFLNEPNKSLFEYFQAAIKNINERIKNIEKTSSRDPEVDLSSNLVIFKDIDTNNIYGIYYAENPEIINYIRSSPYFENFAFWDNSDPDEDCTEEEFELRGVVWNKLLPGYSTPSLNGLVVELMLLQDCYVSILDLKQHSEINKYIAPVEERAKKISRRILIDKIFKEKYSHINGTNISGLFQAIREIEQYIDKEDVGKNRLLEEEKIVSQKIIRDVNLNDSII